MNKIMMIPLDERPCNTNYVKYLSNGLPYEILMPSIELLGDKKQKANTEKLNTWIIDNITDVTHIILSIDMLVYGGIVPSRLHYDSIETLKSRLSIIKKLKELNKDLTVYAFNLIMRNPTYSSNDEEPDYYQDYGREIHFKGVYEHKIDLGIITEEEKQQLVKINKVLPEKYFLDYTSRRQKNLTINEEVIQYTKDNIIDYLVIPQDDASQYGLTTQDQETLKKVILDDPKIIMYPEADAVINTLFVRAINQSNNLKPKTYIIYADQNAENTIPKFEDRPLKASVTQQITAAGGEITSYKEEADVLLYVNAASIMVDINDPQKDNYKKEYLIDRDMDSFISSIKDNIDEYPIILADVAYSNGSDELLINKLKEHDLLFKLAGYAAWNTSGNTLGTCIPMGYIYNLYKDKKAHYDFLGLRYIEDYLYMSKVRKEVTNTVLKDLNYNYFYVEHTDGKVAKIVQGKLQKLANELFETKNVTITKCYMPWRRMFEVGIDVSVDDIFSVEEHTLFKQNEFQQENKKLKGKQIVFLGDSITEHYNVKKHFPNKNVINRGISGDNTKGVLNRLKEAIYDTSPKKVFLLIGTNDLCNGESNETIVSNIEEIVRRIHEYNKKIDIYIQSIYPVHEKSNQKINNIYIICRQNKRIKEINEQLKMIKHTKYIDVYNNICDQDGDIELEYTTEGLHITIEGYKKITQVLTKHV